MRVKIVTEHLKNCFPSLGIPIFMIEKVYIYKVVYDESNNLPDSFYIELNDQRLRFSLENLLTSYTIPKEESALFYLIYLEYIRLIEQAPRLDEFEVTLIQHTKALAQLLSFIDLINRKKDVISEISFKTISGSVLVIRDQRVFEMISFHLKRHPNFLEDFRTSVAVAGGEAPVNQKRGRPIIHKKKIIRFLNSCLLRFIEQYHIDYASLIHSSELPAKSPETFLHDYLVICGLLKHIGVKPWEEIKGSERLTYAGKIDYCKKVKLI